MHLSETLWVLGNCEGSSCPVSILCVGWQGEATSDMIAKEKKLLVELLTICGFDVDLEDLPL